MMVPPLCMPCALVINAVSGRLEAAPVWEKGEVEGLQLLGEHVRAGNATIIVVVVELECLIDGDLQGGALTYIGWAILAARRQPVDALPQQDKAGKAVAQALRQHKYDLQPGRSGFPTTSDCKCISKWCGCRV